MADTDPIQERLDALLRENAKLRAENEELQQSVQAFRAFSDVSPMAIVAASGPDRRIHYLNPRFVALFGFTMEDVPTVEDWWLKAYPNSDYRRTICSEWNARVAKAIETAVPVVPLESVVTCKDGSAKTILWGGAVCENQNIAFGLDVTDQRRVEDAWRQLHYTLELRVAERTAELSLTNSSMEKAARELQLNRYMLDKATSAVYLIDEAGILRYVNECSAKYAGYSREELVGRHVSLLAPEVTEERWRKRWDNVHALPAGKMDVSTMLHRRKDGSHYPIEIHAHHITVEGESYHLSMGMDITERIRAEKEMARNAALSEQALELSRAGHWTARLDDPGYYTSCERLAAIFGDPPAENYRYSIAHWVSCIEAVDPAIAKETIEKFFAARRGETATYDAIYPYRRPVDGRTIWLHALGAIVDDPNNLHPEMCGVVQDITDMMEARQATESALKAAEQANALKSEFLANMSHEIRTPMNAILGYAQLMRRDPGLPAEQLARIETINTAGEHLLAIINDVLEMSKIEAGRVTLNESAFDLRKLLNSLVDLYSARARAKGLSLESSVPGDLPGHIVSDEGKLRQTLVNLLSNAVKFTKIGSVTVTANAVVNSDDTIALAFSVADTGPGIHPDEIRKLFRPFVQSTAGISAGGTGLGLAISRHYARLLGGDIVVESDPGYGSVFTLSMVGRIGSEGQTDQSEIHPQVLRLEPGQHVPRVLVVDDVPFNRELLDSVLTSVGFEVRDAADGREAIELFRVWKPEAVLMDMRMPVMDGFEATRQIKAHPEGKDTFILALTASAFEADKTAVLASGADGFMRKPFKQDELFAILGERFHLRYLHMQAMPAAAASAMQEHKPIDEALRISFTKACHEADYERLLNMCDIIATSGNVATAEAFRERIRSFDYDGLMCLLGDEEVAGKSNSELEA